MTANVLANRGLGPELPMRLVEERAPDGFASIGDVITPDEIAHVTEGYRRTAGFALQTMQDPTSLADTHAETARAQLRTLARRVRSRARPQPRQPARCGWPRIARVGVRNPHLPSDARH